MSCFLLISILDGFMVVAVVGKRPHELLSPRGKFSLSHGDPWVASLDRVAGFLSKQNSELQVGQSPPCHLACHKYFLLYTCTHIFPLLEAPPSATFRLSFMLQTPCHPLWEAVTGYFSPKESPLV